MFVLSAPYPALVTQTTLPNPEFSNQENLTSSVNLRRSVNNVAYTSVRRTDGRKRLLLTFRMRRPKALELRAFMESYYASRILVQDHEGREWTGYFTNNPFEFNGASRAYPIIGDVAGEINTITLEFEGKEL